MEATKVGLRIECPPDGAFHSKIAIVGEYVGDREVKLQRPMSGEAGALLWSALEQIGIKRNEVYTTNVVKRQLSFAGGNIKKSIKQDELSHWESLLHWELSLLPNLTYIVLLGNLPLSTIADKQGITGWRGSVIPVEYGINPNLHTATALIANNPAMARRSSKEELPFRFHIGKLRSLLNGTFKPYEIAARYDLSSKEVHDELDRIHEEGTRECDPLPVSIDIETIGGETACIGFANDPHSGFCLNFRDRSTNKYTLTEERNIYRRVQRLFSDTRIHFVAQNGNFDTYWLWYKDRLIAHKIWFDTMLAHHLLYPRLPHNLGFLTTQYTSHPFYKDEKDEWKEGGDISSFWEYNVKDACITLAVQRKLLKELQGAKMDSLFFRHIMAVQPHLVRMTVLGIRVDRPLKDVITEECEEEVQKILHQFHSKVHETTGDDEYNPMPSSPKQMQELYFRQLRLVGRGTTVNEANRKRMKVHPKTSPAAKELIELHDKYAKETKFLGTYAKMRIDPDERVRCEYKQIGVESAPGRLSSAAVMWGSGTNLQNQPARAQRMYLSDEGYVFCYFDLSQAEARVVAYLADIPAWKEQFERARIDGSYDCHRALASEMFKIPYDEVPEKDRDENDVPTIRFTSKRCRHGLNYRMEIDRLAETTGLPYVEASIAYHAYHRTTPELRIWWEKTEREALENRVLYSPYGRRILIPRHIEDGDLDNIIAFRPQSTVGDKVCEVLYRSEDDPDWPSDSRVVLNIHDALIALSKPSNAARTLEVMKRHAEAPIMINGEELIIPAELGVSMPDDTGKHRWNTITKVKSLDDVSKVLAA